MKFTFEVVEDIAKEDIGSCNIDGSDLKIPAGSVIYRFILGDATGPRLNTTISGENMPEGGLSVMARDIFPMLLKTYFRKNKHLSDSQPVA